MRDTMHSMCMHPATSVHVRIDRTYYICVRMLYVPMHREHAHGNIDYYDGMCPRSLSTS